MGAAFGIVDSDKKKAAYDSLPPDKKAQVDEVLGSVKQDMESAEDKVDEYVDEQTEEVDRKQKFEKEPQKVVKTDDLGEIQFDAENVTDASEGRPSVVAESKEDPASFTESISTNKLEENAEKDQAGIPSEERIGEEPIETQPIAEAGKEEVSPGGMVQEEREVKLNENLPKVEIEGEVVEETPSQEVKTFADRIINGKKIKSPEDAKFYEDNKEQVDTYIKDTREKELAQAKGEAKVATPVAATMFTEASDISKIKKRADRQAAEIAFQEKHGVTHKKVSKIDTNFAGIVKNLENNNLIEKEC